MKKFLSLSVIFAALTSLLTFSSCGDDEEAKGPKVEIVNPSVVIGQETTVTVKITAGDAKVTSWDVTVDGVSVLTEDQKKLDKSQTIQEPTFTFIPREGNKVVVTVTDKDKNVASTEFVVEVAKEEKEPENEYTLSTITVEKGKSYGFQQGSVTGSFTVVSIDGTDITLSINGSEVTLGDANSSLGSYLSTSYTVLKSAEAKAAPASLLLIYKGSKIIASATQAASAEISGAATSTLFAAQ